MKGSVLTVCANPSIQKTLVFSGLVRDKVNRAGEYYLDASGKGINVSRVLIQLGKECCHLTQLGGIFRPLFLELCARDNIRVEWTESSSPIRFCYTVLDRADRSVTELVEEAERVGEGTGERLFKMFSGLLGKFSTLVISGTKAAGFRETLVPEMVRAAKAKGLRVILDIRGKDLVESLPFVPDIIKPNLEEFVSTYVPSLVSYNGVYPGDINVKKIIEETWAGLYERYPCSIILTRGADSVWYAEKGNFAEYRVEPVEPFNTTGSGDAFTAGIASACEDGASLEEAVAEGVRCGALNALLPRPGVIR